MEQLEFEARGLTDGDLRRRRLHRLIKRRPQPIVALAVAAGLIYLLGRSGTRVDPSQVAVTPIGERVTKNVILVQGSVADATTKQVQVYSNSVLHVAPVANGRFALPVQLISGENSVQVVAGGVASPVHRFIADIPRTDVWVALSRDNPPADIDLHLELPDGKDCWEGNCSAPAAFYQDDLGTNTDPEHLTVVNAPPGKYRVWIHYYGTGPPGSGPVNCNVTVRLGEGKEQQVYQSVLKAPGDRHDVCTFTLPLR